MKNHSLFDRRGFIKRGLLFLPTILIPRFDSNPMVVELFNRDGSDVFHLPRGGLQAASTIKQRTFSSVVDNRIKLTNSNFARPWSTDIGTSWTTIRIGCRFSIEDSGANVTSLPRFYFGICSGTSNIVMDATTTHFLGFISGGVSSGDDTWTRTAGPPAYYTWNTGYAHFVTKVGSTFAAGSGSGGPTEYVFDASTANRSALFIDITKGSPFSCKYFTRNSTTASDVAIDTYLAQLPLSTPTITNHAFGAATHTITVNEATNGYFNEFNVGWDRTSPAIEISDLAVVKFA